jgi:hypothetical protein
MLHSAASGVLPPLNKQYPIFPSHLLELTAPANSANIISAHPSNLTAATLRTPITDYVPEISGKERKILQTSIKALGQDNLIRMIQAGDHHTKNQSGQTIVETPYFRIDQLIYRQKKTLNQIIFRTRFFHLLFEKEVSVRHLLGAMILSGIGVTAVEAVLYPVVKQRVRPILKYSMISFVAGCIALPAILMAFHSILIASINSRMKSCEADADFKKLRAQMKAAKEFVKDQEWQYQKTITPPIQIEVNQSF